MNCRSQESKTFLSMISPIELEPTISFPLFQRLTLVWFLSLSLSLLVLYLYSLIMLVCHNYLSSPSCLVPLQSHNQSSNNLSLERELITVIKALCKAWTITWSASAVLSKFQPLLTRKAPRFHKASCLYLLQHWHKLKHLPVVLLLTKMDTSSFGSSIKVVVALLSKLVTWTVMNVYSRLHSILLMAMTHSLHKKLWLSQSLLLLLIK